MLFAAEHDDVDMLRRRWTGLVCGIMLIPTRFRRSRCGADLFVEGVDDEALGRVADPRAMQFKTIGHLGSYAIAAEFGR